LPESGDRTVDLLREIARRQAQHREPALGLLTGGERLIQRRLLPARARLSAFRTSFRG